jgi:hypothetical protein
LNKLFGTNALLASIHELLLRELQCIGRGSHSASLAAFATASNPLVRDQIVNSAIGKAVQIARFTMVRGVSAMAEAQDVRMTLTSEAMADTL